MSTAGTFYGVGLGPGDPELMTCKAHRLISNASVVAYPTLAGGDSLTRSIAADVIPKNAREIAMDIPMTLERAPAQRAYDRAAVQIADELRAGAHVLCLCEGDPLFYGSFMYLFARLSKSFAVEIVPGVTSLSACSARAQLPLVARCEGLVVLPATLGKQELETSISRADGVAILKVGRHLPKIRAVIERLGLLDNAVYVERATLANEHIAPLADAPKTAPYFSMVLLTRGTDPWL